MKATTWVLMIVVALALGALLAKALPDQNKDGATSPTETTTDGQPVSNEPEPAPLGIENAGVEAETQAEVAAEPEPVVIPPFMDIAYQPSTTERAAVQTLKNFYVAYNAGDAAAMAATFDLSVSVTAEIDRALAEGQPRPVQVVINQIDTRSDGSQVVTLEETRFGLTGQLRREIELMPGPGGTLIVAYRTVGVADPTSGFLAR